MAVGMPCAALLGRANVLNVANPSGEVLRFSDCDVGDVGDDFRVVIYSSSSL